MATTVLLDDPTMLPLISKAKEEGLEAMIATQVQQAEHMLAKYGLPEFRHRADMGAGPLPSSPLVVVAARADVSSVPVIAHTLAGRIVLPPVRILTGLTQQCQDTLLDEETQLVATPPHNEHRVARSGDAAHYGGIALAIPKVVIPPMKIEKKDGTDTAIPKVVPPPKAEIEKTDDAKHEVIQTTPDGSTLGLDKFEAERAAAAAATEARVEFLEHIIPWSRILSQ